MLLPFQQLRRIFRRKTEHPETGSPKTERRAQTSAGGSLPAEIFEQIMAYAVEPPVFHDFGRERLTVDQLAEQCLLEHQLYYATVVQVCRGWYFEAIEALYRHPVALDARALASLSDTVNRRSDLAGFVEGLTVYEPDIPKIDPPPRTRLQIILNIRHRQEDPIISINRPLYSLVEVCHNVSALCLSNLAWTGDHPKRRDWTLPDDFLAPNLRRLTLCGGYILPNMYPRLPIEELTFSNCVMRAERGIDWCPSIKSLRVIRVVPGTISDWEPMFRPPAFPPLERLALIDNMWLTSWFAAELMECSAKLKVLIIIEDPSLTPGKRDSYNEFYRRHHIFEHLRMTAFPKLRALVVGTWLYALADAAAYFDFPPDLEVFVTLYRRGTYHQGRFRFVSEDRRKDFLQLNANSLRSFIADGWRIRQFSTPNHGSLERLLNDDDEVVEDIEEGQPWTSYLIIEVDDYVRPPWDNFCSLL